MVSNINTKRASFLLINDGIKNSKVSMPQSISTKVPIIIKVAPIAVFRVSTS